MIKKLSQQSLARVRRSLLMNGPHDDGCSYVTCSGPCVCTRYAEENATCKVGRVNNA